MKTLLKISFLSLFLFSSSCAYRLGYGNREMPNKIKKVFVPVFLNDSLETGEEVAFTNELIRELKRSGAAQVVSKASSEAILEGRIVRVANAPFQIDLRKEDTVNDPKTSGLVFLPPGGSLATKYLVKIRVELRLKTKNGKTIWKQWFDDEKLYSAPVITLPGVNASTPIYNISERERVTEELARLMMHEAVGRLTESF